mmetsp:Transcript_26696/g.58459  ORF Transcript_26696/g.58459 Transcript_26696/m.58459 type:complete len:285 (+) Transcript_26696:99-953(+)
MDLTASMLSATTSKRAESAAAVGVAAAAAAAVAACMLCAGIISSHRRRRKIGAMQIHNISDEQGKFRKSEDDSTESTARLKNVSSGGTIARDSTADTESTASISHHRYEEIFSTKAKLSSRAEKDAYYDTCITNASNPTLLSNFLRPWQSAFLQSLDILTAEQLIDADRRGGDVSMSNAMCAYCANHEGMPRVDTHSCYNALKGWCQAARGVARYVRRVRVCDQERTVRFAGVSSTFDAVDVGGDTTSVSSNTGFVREISIDSSAAASELDNVSTLGFDESVTD